MNLEKLFIWITGIVFAFASTGRLDTLQEWIWKSQVKVIYESRSSNWGSPRFFLKNNEVRKDFIGKK